MKDDILKLRLEGKSYRQIVTILGCSKGTVAYHCGEGQKKKSLERNRENKKENVVRAKTYKFCEVHNKLEKNNNKKKNNNNNKKKNPVVKPIEKTVYEKCFSFRRKAKSKVKYKFDWKDVIEKFGWEPNCYLTGRKLNLKNGAEYQFDHIVPISKGGSCEIENLGITYWRANISKYDMLVDEFIELCKDVLIHNGYDVSKKKKSLTSKSKKIKIFKS